MKSWLACIGLFFIVGCNAPKDRLDTVLSSTRPNLRLVLDRLGAHEVQFMFTEIHRNQNTAEVVFDELSFQCNDSTYFYPASTVKFPMAIMALEKMEKEKIMDKTTKFYIEGDTVETTIAAEIEKIFAVSDNDAFNRLFEYVGQDEVNERLKALEIVGQLTHRLSVNDADNVTTKPLIYYLNDSTTRTTSPIINTPIKPVHLKNIVKGKAYYRDGILIEEPMDFSRKNYFPIASLHTVMKRLVFPANFPEHLQFKLSEENRRFLLNAMKILPRQAGYNPDEYYDSYGKFLVFGDQKKPIPSTVEIRNKVGYAYGYLTDCAYITTKTTGKEYLITATVFVNENLIFNDNHYEYDSIGIPFLAELGRVLIGE